MLRIKKIKPRMTEVLTTCEKYEEDIYRGGMIEDGKTAGSLKFYQKVIAVGDMVRDIKVGDTVMINMEDFVVRKYDKNSIQNDLDNNKKVSMLLPIVENVEDEMGNLRNCLLISDRSILYVFEGEEINEKIQVQGKKLVVPNKKIILN